MYIVSTPKIRASTLFAAISLSACASAPLQPPSLAFSTRLLDGWWSDNSSTSPSCSQEQPRVRYVFSADGTRVTLEFDRKWDTEIGEADRFGARIVSATDRSLVIQYDKESRFDPSGRPVQWELVVVGPSVYRWRAAGWPTGTVNVVVGIKCAV